MPSKVETLSSEMVVSMWRVLLEAEKLGVQEYSGWRGSVSQDFSSEDSLLSQSPGFQLISSFFYKLSNPEKQLELLQNPEPVFNFSVKPFLCFEIFALVIILNGITTCFSFFNWF